MTPRDRPVSPCGEITEAMLATGVRAFRDWDSESEEVEALVWAILSRALVIRDFSFDQSLEPDHSGRRG